MGLDKAHTKTTADLTHYKEEKQLQDDMMMQLELIKQYTVQNDFISATAVARLDEAIKSIHLKFKKHQLNLLCEAHKATKGE
jgi:hypothetical protein